MFILAKMNVRTIKIVVFSGAMAILCIVVVQLKFMWQSLNQEQREFNQSVQLALLDVVRQFYYNPNSTPIENPVKQLSDDYFVVDINQNIHAGVLEIYLVETFAKYRIENDFEYAIYNCENDQMVYGNYLSGGNVKPVERTTLEFNKSPDLTYYFGVHFPAIKWQLARSLSLWIALVFISVVVVAFFSYTIFVIWRQKRLSEMQRDFINNITHEFKTPLSSLTLAANYLNHRPGMDERSKNYAHIIKQQADLLTGKVEKILQVASLEKLYIENNVINVDLAELLRSIVDFEQSSSRNAMIKFKTEIKSCLVQIIPAHLETLMLNLLDNAIKYGGNPPAVAVHLSKRKKMYCISISDRGPGIARQHLKHIFRKFYRVPGVGDRQKGFGLGLYQVKQIVKQNKWFVQVQSVLGEGTIFTIKIPVKK